MARTMRMWLALLAIGASVCFSSTSNAQIPCKYDVQIIPNVDCGLFGGPMILTAINIHGEVIGWGAGCGGSKENRSYTWNGGPVLTQLPIPPGSIGFRASDINDNGIICGTANFANGRNRAYVYNRFTNQWTQIAPVNIDAGWSGATAVNNAGIVVGYRGLGDDHQGRPWNAIIYDSTTGKLTDLGVMNGPSSGANAVSDDNTVVGWTGSSNAYIFDDVRAFIRRKGTTTVLDAIPGGFSSSGLGVNSSGQALIIGCMEASPQIISRTFLHHIDGMQPLAVPPGFDRVGASSITGQGLVGGSCNTVDDSTFYGFLWIGSQYVSINSLISASTGVTKVSVSRLNESRQIIGEAYNGQWVNVRLSPRPQVIGDATCDEFVNVSDLLAIINSWGACNSCRADLDSNGIVNVSDLIIVLQNWGNSS